MNYSPRETKEKRLNSLKRKIEDVVKEQNVENMMLIEARARQKYYSAFNHIMENESFQFSKRTRRPPEDNLNAMISFGNTLLYNCILQIMWRTPLDPRVGVIHSANNRNHTLNLDFADIFKPVIVDRVIFSLVNCHQIKKEHFENKNNGVYLNKEGKKIFITAFENKLQQKIVQKGNKSMTYKQLLEKEVRDYQKYVQEERKYKPYKYY